MENVQDLTISLQWLQELGKVVARKREQSEMSRRTLATLSGITEKGLKDFEEGTNNISVSVLNRIATALKTKSSLLTKEVDTKLHSPGIDRVLNEER